MTTCLSPDHPSSNGAGLDRPRPSLSFCWLGSLASLDSLGGLAHGTRARARRDGPICWSNVTISKEEQKWEWAGGGGVVRNTHSQVHALSTHI